MSRQFIDVTIELLSETIISSGHKIPGGEDISIRLDHSGRPWLSGSTVKGLLRESMENLLVWKDMQDDAILNRMFGIEGHVFNDTGRLVIDSFRIRETGEWKAFRSFNALEARVSKKKTLRVATCLRRHLHFDGRITCDAEDSETVTEALQMIKFLGLMRNRGFGRVKVTTAPPKPCEAEENKPIGDTRWLRYTLVLKTPMTLGYQHGGNDPAFRKNNLETRQYIPGSAIRGYVASRLAEADADGFASCKQSLLGDGAHFLNAFPLLLDAEKGNVRTLPVPMGFCEGKLDGRFYSTIFEDMTPGDKSAPMKSFCCLERTEDPDSGEEQDILICGEPKTERSLRILRGEEKQMFTSGAIAAGTRYEGYIYLRNPELVQVIANQLRGEIWIGADRYAGNGLCSVEVEAAEEPYWFSESAANAMPDTVQYMMLLSPTTMLRDGEPVGIHEEALAKLLGVQSVRIQRCAVSVTELQGYNRKLGTQTPSLPMYGAGSVFQLVCSPAPSPDRLRALEETGIGVRRNEGCGQVLFLRDFPKICGWRPLRFASTKQEEQAVAFRRARCAWLLREAGTLPSALSKSQIGDVQALCELAIAKGGDVSELNRHFIARDRIVSPRLQKPYQQLHKKLKAIWETALSETIGVMPLKDDRVERLKLIVDLLNLSRKEGERL